MRRVRRIGTVMGIAIVVVFAVAAPASADGWGWTDCEQNPHAGCELGAGEGQGGSGGQPDQGSGGAEGDGQGGGGGQREESGNNEDVADCAYERAEDYQPSGGAQQSSTDTLSGEDSAPRAQAAGAWPGSLSSVALPAAEEDEEDGSWYVWRCSGSGTRDAVYRPPVWMEDASSGEQGPSVQELAQRAYNQLRLPEPEIESSPAGDQLVHVPTWLWLAEWEEVSATASAGEVSVTATARPTQARWEMGDGTTVVCEGPGTPYQGQGDPASASPDCGHTYTASSAGQPGEAYAVSVQVSWSVTWSGAGEQGEFDGLTTTATTSFPVLESQAVTQ